MIDQIRAELVRLEAHEVEVSDDGDFEPAAGHLVQVDLAGAYWHLLPEHFLGLLAALPDGAGATSVHQAIESEGQAVWHGPAPPESRDSTL